MFVVFETGGKQFRASKGDKLIVEKLSGEAGEKITFHRVFLFSDDKKVVVGKPVLENIKILAKIIKHGKAEKVRVIKMKPKKRYRRNYGHRQHFSEIEILEIKNDKD